MILLPLVPIGTGNDLIMARDEDQKKKWPPSPITTPASCKNLLSCRRQVSLLPLATGIS